GARDRPDRAGVGARGRRDAGRGLPRGTGREAGPFELPAARGSARRRPRHRADEEASMTDAKGVFEALRARGGQVLAQVSTELMESPHFARAMEGALRGKQRLDEAVGRVLKN